MTITEFLSDPAVRSAVVAELRRMDEVATQSGNRAERSGLYKLAASNWMVAAQRGRAAEALTVGVEVDPRGRRHVVQASASVRDRMREAAGLLSHADDARAVAA
jgi:hypothetical protein